MIPKIDKLIVKSFIGPFIMTSAVVIFILLLRFLLMYFAYFLGKDLGYDVFAKLFGYFSLITVPTALPLSILLASLVCFGNLGEFSELTALKSAGIPITRIFRPSFIMAIFIAALSFWFNVSVSPWSNLKGFSLLYDIKYTKLTMNIENGVFYTGIPGYAIKVKEKMPDGKTLKGVMIYDHHNYTGNVDVTLADSGKMYAINNGSYFVFELFNGYNFRDVRDPNAISFQQFLKNKFKHNKLIMSLESFGMKRTNEESFSYHPYMKNIRELQANIDSLAKDEAKTKNYYGKSSINMYSYHQRPIADSSRVIKMGKWVDERLKKALNLPNQGSYLEPVMSDIQGMKSHFEINQVSIDSKKKETFGYEVELQHKYTQTYSILILFIIGAALGSVIKKGGFGMPVLIAVSIFILMYIFTQYFDKLAKEGEMAVIPATWATNFILSVFAIYVVNLALTDRGGQFAIIDRFLDFFKKWLADRKYKKTGDTLISQ